MGGKNDRNKTCEYSFFPALEQQGFKNGDCILNSVTVPNRSKLYSVVASMIALPWKDVGSS